jgi:hypothetical protein
VLFVMVERFAGKVRGTGVPATVAPKLNPSHGDD